VRSEKVKMFDAPKYGVISTNLKYRLEKDLITEKNNLRGEGKDDGSTMIPFSMPP